MSSTRSSVHSELFAVLIGAGCYLPGQGGGIRYPSLSGSVHDVHAMEEYLRRRLRVDPKRIVRLSSTAGRSGTSPVEPPELWPTYENMVGAIREVSRRAKSGATILIHYAGHGGRVPSLIPEVKGPNALDETLVPVNAADPTSRHLRDIELNWMLREMVDRGLFVVLALDCCHGGGMMRGATRFVPRGIRAVDRTARPDQSMVASTTQLADLGRNVLGTFSRPRSAAFYWVPQGKGYVFMAACRPAEQAFEGLVGGKQERGLFSAALVEALWGAEPGTSYKSLYDRLLGRIYGRVTTQTPVLEGELSRQVWGQHVRESPLGINVLTTDNAEGQILLQVGESQGVRPGTRLGIASVGSTPNSQAVVEVTQTGATTAWARPLPGAQTVRVGEQLAVVDYGNPQLGVRLVRESHESAVCREAFSLLEACLERHGKSLLRLTTQGQRADFQVAIAGDRQFQILGRDGSPLPCQTPRLSIQDPRGPERVVLRLVHLARFRRLHELDNASRQSPLHNALDITAAHLSADFQIGEYPSTADLEWSRQRIRAEPGDWICILIRNRSAKQLAVAVLDLRPDWSVVQVHPDDGRAFAELEPLGEKKFALKAGLPSDLVRGIDTLKVFATIDAPSFRWLAMPPLRQVGRAWRGGHSGFDAWLAEQVPFPSEWNTVSSERDWTAATFGVEVSLPLPGFSSEPSKRFSESGT